MRDKWEIALVHSLRERLDTPDTLPALRSPAGARVVQSPAPIVFRNRIVKTELFAFPNTPHRDKEKTPPDPDIRLAGVVDMTRRKLWVNPEIFTDTDHVLILIRLLRSFLDDVMFSPLEDKNSLTTLQVLCSKNTLTTDC